MEEYEKWKNVLLKHAELMEELWSWLPHSEMLQ